MTLWLWTPDEERFTRGRQESYAILPLEPLPNLSKVRGGKSLALLIKNMHPDEPPERHDRIFARFYPLRNKIATGDIVAALNPTSGEMALGEVMLQYCHSQQEHRTEVRWQTKTVPPRALVKHKTRLSQLPRNGFQSVEDEKLRTAIYGYLERGYNRFRAIKWIIFIALGLKILHSLTRRGGLF